MNQILPNPLLSSDQLRVPRCDRRQVLRYAIAGCAVGSMQLPGLSVEPFVRPIPGQLRLSLAAYSLRELLNKPTNGMNLFQFVDFCQQQGIPGAELTSYYFPKEVTNEYLVELKQHCHRKGITISGGAIRNDFCQSDAAKIRDDIEQAKKWIDHYAVLGAPVIRIFAGTQPKNDSWDATVARCVEACETLGKYAAQKGIYLGLENHGGVTAKAEGLLEIVRKINSKSLGVNFDSGNFRTTEDPYTELAQIAPYAVNAQVKVEIVVNNKKQETDLVRVLNILRNAGYSGWVALEYEAAEAPLVAIPKWLDKLKAIIA
jgi:sugar phosphate isomerase/epimerase